MKVKLLGIRELQFTNDSGESIRGKSIYTAFEDESVVGYRTEKFFLKEGIELPKDTKINDTLDISFNMKGKVEMVQKA